MKKFKENKGMGLGRLLKVDHKCPQFSHLVKFQDGTLKWVPQWVFDRLEMIKEV